MGEMGRAQGRGSASLDTADATLLHRGMAYAGGDRQKSSEMPHVFPHNVGRLFGNLGINSGTRSGLLVNGGLPHKSKEPML